MRNQTTEEMEATLGENLRSLRLSRNIDQKTVAERAGVSLKALKNLEGGHGSTLKTLVSVLRAYGREEWLGSVAPVATINPLTVVRGPELRQRARPKILKLPPNSVRHTS